LIHFYKRMSMLDTFIRLNNTRGGHDKLVRVAQYTCKLVAASQITNPETARLLEKTLSSSRKLLRLGTCIEALRSAVSSVGQPDLTLRLSLTLGRISSAMYLFTDHLLWLHQANLIKLTDRQNWKMTSNRCWLYSIIMALVRDVYEIYKILKAYSTTQNSKLHLLGTPTPDLIFIKHLIDNHKSVVLDLLRNLSDVVIPLDTLGYIDTPKLSGFLGVLSSLIATLQLVNPGLIL